MQYASDPLFQSTDTVLQMLGNVQRLLTDGLSLEWGIESKVDRILIGTCGLHSFAEPEETAEVGCMLSKDAWGKGVMTEALLPIIQFGIHDLGVRRLLADIDEPNARSISLFQRLGFRHTGGSQYELPAFPLMPSVKDKPGA